MVCVPIERLLGELSRAYPTLASRIDGYQRPATILEDSTVCSWLPGAAELNHHGVTRLQYHIIRIAGGGGVSQLSLKLSKASPVHFTSYPGCR